MQNVNHTGYSRYPRYCPVCARGRVVDVPMLADRNTEICLLKPGQDEQAVLFVKCPKCKNQIGVGLVVA